MSQAFGSGALLPLGSPWSVRGAVGPPRRGWAVGGTGVDRRLPEAGLDRGRRGRYLLVVADDRVDARLDTAVRRRHHELAPVAVHVLARRRRSWLWLAASAACPFTGYLPYDASCDAAYRARDSDPFPSSVRGAMQRLADGGLAVSGSVTPGEPSRVVAAWASQAPVAEVLVAPAPTRLGRWRHRRLVRRLRRRLTVPVRAAS